MQATTVGLLVALATACAAPSHHDEPYGYLHVEGDSEPSEFFRASFGHLADCSMMKASVAADGVGCAVAEQPYAPNTAVLALRGSCTFFDKAVAAKKAGASALIVVNNQAGLLRMPQGNQTSDLSIDFPVVMVANRSEATLLPLVRAGVPLALSLRPSSNLCSGRDPATGRKLPRKGLRGKPAGSVSEVLVRRSTEAAEVVVVGMANEQPLDIGLPGPIEGALAFFGGTANTKPRRVVVANPRHACTGSTGASDQESGEPPAVGLGSISEEERAAGAGPVAIVERGVCPMVDKARAVQAAGASAVIIINNDQTSQLFTFERGQGSEEPASGALPPNTQLGTARAAPDDSPGDVIIPAVMVSSFTGEQLVQVATEGVSGEPARVQLRPSLGKASFWEHLRHMRAAARRWVAPEEADRRQAIWAAVEQHHPSSPHGNWERFAALTGLLRWLHLEEELTATVQAVDFSELPLDWDAYVSGPLPPKALGAEDNPASAFLIGRRSVHGASPRNGDAPGLVCGTDGSLLARQHEYDPSSLYPTTKRIRDLLTQHACLERMLLHVSDNLGQYFSKLEAELEPSNFRRAVQSLWDMHHVTPEEARRRTKALQQLSANLASVPEPRETSVDDMLRAAFETVGSDE